MFLALILIRSLIISKEKLNNEKLLPMEPYYNGFKGKIIKKDKFNYITKGNYEVVTENKITITELPIGKWTDDYIKFVQDNIIGEKERKKNCFITDYENHSTDSEVRIILKVTDEFIYDYEHSTADSDGITFIEKHLKLTSNKSLTNIHLYNSNNQIKKYNNALEIIDGFFTTRYDLYVKRKDYLLNILDSKISILKSKIRFINDIIDENIVIYKKSKKDIISQLYSKEYILLNDNIITSVSDKSLEEVNNDYDYLIKMPIYSLSEEKIDELNKELQKNVDEFNTLEGKTIKDLWSEELDKLKMGLERLIN